MSEIGSERETRLVDAPTFVGRSESSETICERVINANEGLPAGTTVRLPNGRGEASEESPGPSYAVL